MRLEEEDETPVPTRELYEPYNEVCREMGIEPVSDRAVREYLAELDTLGIIEGSEINRGKGGGKFKEHQLNQSVQSVRNGLSAFVEP